MKLDFINTGKKKYAVVYMKNGVEIFHRFESDRYAAYGFGENWSMLGEEYSYRVIEYDRDKCIDK